MSTWAESRAFLRSMLRGHGPQRTGVGANAIVAVRYDASEVASDVTEILAWDGGGWS
jgi:uncharacterized protein YbjQ (UPF0145 family)